MAWIPSFVNIKWRKWPGWIAEWDRQTLRGGQVKKDSSEGLLGVKVLRVKHVKERCGCVQTRPRAMSAALVWVFTWTHNSGSSVHSCFLMVFLSVYLQQFSDNSQHMLRSLICWLISGQVRILTEAKYFFMILFVQGEKKNANLKA